MEKEKKFVVQASVRSEIDEFGTLCEYDENGNLTYLEDVNGYWIKWKYDEQGNIISFYFGIKSADFCGYLPKHVSGK